MFDRPPTASEVQELQERLGGTVSSGRAAERAAPSPIAWAGVTWPEVTGLSSRARQSAASDSIFAVSV